jgi:hypothetical protein
MGLRTHVLSVASALAVLLTPLGAHAFDPFEIQIYDGSANDPGEAGLELHTNHVLRGHKTAEAPETPTHRQTHLTLEPSLGITRSWELGAYFQTSFRGDGKFDYAGTKLRSKLVTPPGWHSHLRLGLNIEVGKMPAIFGGEWGTELRPIIAWENADWLLAANPNIGTALAGCKEADECFVPELEPGAMVVRKAEGVASFGFEWYGSLGPVRKPLPVGQQIHYLFFVANILAAEGWELNMAVGRGLTAESEPWLIKAIVGHALGKLW